MKLKTLWHNLFTKEDKKSPQEATSDHFKYRTALEMRFTDLDAMAHVNNAVYFTYMEIGRTKYWQNVIKWDWNKTAIVIKTANAEYIKPLYLEDKISIYVRTARIGNTSFDLQYLIIKNEHGNETICCRAKTTCVVINRSTGEPTSIPEKERQKMIEFEQLQPL